MALPFRAAMNRFGVLVVTALSHAARVVAMLIGRMERADHVGLGLDRQMEANRAGPAGGTAGLVAVCLRHAKVGYACPRTSPEAQQTGPCRTAVTGSRHAGAQGQTETTSRQAGGDQARHCCAEWPATAGGGPAIRPAGGSAARTCPPRLQPGSADWPDGRADGGSVGPAGPGGGKPAIAHPALRGRTLRPAAAPVHGNDQPQLPHPLI